MSFSDLVKAAKKRGDQPVVGDALKTFLENKCAKPSLRAPGYHVSSLYYMCPRSVVLQRVLGVSGSPPSAILQAKFDIGHAMHAWYQNKYFGPMGILWGRWNCSSCGDMIRNSFMPEVPCDCENSRIAVWEYVETRVFCQGLNIVGHCDGIIDRGDGDQYVLELKTMDPYLFSKLKEPQEAHKCQVRWYAWMQGIDKGLIVYIDKSANGKDPIKEFVVKHDSETIEMVRAKIMTCERAFADKTIPERTCDNKSCAKAKYCSLKTLCFDQDAVTAKLDALIVETSEDKQ